MSPSYPFTSYCPPPLTPFLVVAPRLTKITPRGAVLPTLGNPVLDTFYSIIFAILILTQFKKRIVKVLSKALTKTTTLCFHLDLDVSLHNVKITGIQVLSPCSLLTNPFKSVQGL